jgi:hypothetical protein
MFKKILDSLQSTDLKKINLTIPQAVKILPMPQGVANTRDKAGRAPCMKDA